jgi:hypothetical protein
MQVRLQPAMWIGLLFAAGALVAPATLQTIVAWRLRVRGGGWLQAAIHYCELTLPASLVAVTWASLVWRRPLAAAAMAIGPLLLAAGFARARRLSSPARRWVIGGLAVLAIGLLWLLLPDLFPQRDPRFSRSPMPTFGVLVIGAAAAALAVLQRWKWWLRLAIYALWIALWTGDWREIGGEEDPQVGDLLVVCGAGFMALLVAGCAYFHRRR